MEFGLSIIEELNSSFCEHDNIFKCEVNILIRRFIAVQCGFPVSLPKILRSLEFSSFFLNLPPGLIHMTLFGMGLTDTEPKYILIV